MAYMKYAQNNMIWSSSKPVDFTQGTGVVLASPQACADKGNLVVSTSISTDISCGTVIPGLNLSGALHTISPTAEQKPKKLPKKGILEAWMSEDDPVKVYRGRYGGVFDRTEYLLEWRGYSCVGTKRCVGQVLGGWIKGSPQDCCVGEWERPRPLNGPISYSEIRLGARGALAKLRKTHPGVKAQKASSCQKVSFWGNGRVKTVAFCTSWGATLVFWAFTTDEKAWTLQVHHAGDVIEQTFGLSWIELEDRVAHICNEPDE